MSSCNENAVLAMPDIVMVASSAALPFHDRSSGITGEVTVYCSNGSMFSLIAPAAINSPFTGTGDGGMPGNEVFLSNGLA